MEKKINHQIVDVILGVVPTVVNEFIIPDIYIYVL